MAAAYNLSPLAYLKIILHAAKYPSSTCVGLLLGQVEGTNVHIVDAIPLLHHWSELSPMMEAGLIMADIHATDSGRVLVGLYVCNELLSDTTLPSNMVKVADALKKECAPALVLVLDNQKLSTTEAALVPYLAASPSQWKPTSLSAASITLTDTTIPAKALEQVRAGSYKQLGDFDEHLEDVRVDWLSNKSVRV